MITRFSGIERLTKNYTKTGNFSELCVVYYKGNNIITLLWLLRNKSTHQLQKIPLSTLLWRLLALWYILRIQRIHDGPVITQSCILNSQQFVGECGAWYVIKWNKVWNSKNGIFSQFTRLHQCLSSSQEMYHRG